MTVEQAMAAVAVHVYNDHARDDRFHAGIIGLCGTCHRLGEAAATLQEAATASVGLVDGFGPDDAVGRALRTSAAIDKEVRT